MLKQWTLGGVLEVSKSRVNASVVGVLKGRKWPIRKLDAKKKQGEIKHETYSKNNLDRHNVFRGEFGNRIRRVRGTRK